MQITVRVDRMAASGTSRHFAVVPNDGRDRSEADMPRASRPCGSDQNEPTADGPKSRSAVRIQDRVVHNPIYKVVNYGSNRIDAAETFVERRLAAF
jgi:hypothetical protein